MHVHKYLRVMIQACQYVFMHFEVCNTSTNTGRLGVLALSRTLPTLLSLKSLDLSKNKLVDAEVVVLMSSINESYFLENLNLSHNNIASMGAQVCHCVNRF